ncbi:MAG: hypothetical protein HFG64_15825 [Lachnospiraceae bacterium]|nr:hypothetical protein [Lachnospiraceae bacterium]
MERMNQVKLLLFLLFLTVSAVQDFRSQSVSVRVYAVFGMAAVVWNIGMILGMAGIINGTEPAAVVSGREAVTAAEEISGIRAGADMYIGETAPYPDILSMLGSVGLGRALSCGVGLGLLAVGWASQGRIGAGDGCFFLISGLLLDAGENFWLLSVSVFLCGLSSLGILAGAQLAGRQKARTDTLAFLPFVAIGGAAGAVMGVIK